MKVAICISGLSREFKRSYPSLKTNLFDRCDHDLFIYTWDAPVQPYFEIEGSIRYPDEGPIGEYRDLYKPTLMQYELFDAEREKSFDKPEYYKRKHAHTSVVRMSAMFYQIFKCNEMKNNYAKKHNINYDVVVKCRSDLELLRPMSQKDLEEARGNNILFTDVLRHDGMVSDILFFGNTEVMDYVCDLYNYFEEYNTKHRIQFNPEIYMPHHLIQGGIPPRKHFIGQVNVLRPEQAKW